MNPVSPPPSDAELRAIVERLEIDLAHERKMREAAETRLRSYEDALRAEATNPSGFMPSDAEYLEILASYGGRSVSSQWLCEHARRIRGTLKMLADADRLCADYMEEDFALPEMEALRIGGEGLQRHKSRLSATDKE